MMRRWITRRWMHETKPIVQTFTVEAECDLCSKEEINAHLPVVCVARGGEPRYGHYNHHH